MTKWEYKIVVVQSGVFGGMGHLEQVLQQAGEDGWESSGFIPEGTVIHVVFKREIEPEPPTTAL